MKKLLIATITALGILMTTSSAYAAESIDNNIIDNSYVSHMKSKDKNKFFVDDHTKKDGFTMDSPEDGVIKLSFQHSWD